MSNTVLYIEDNTDNVLIVERILKRRPHLDLVVASTGAEGVRMAEKARPSMVLLDRRLPDMPGTEVLRQLKDSNPTAAIPVVVISGDSDPEATREVLELGASGFLAKPFDLTEFLMMIDTFCPDGPHPSAEL